MSPDSYDGSTGITTPDPDTGWHSGPFPTDTGCTSTADPDLDVLAPPPSIAQLNNRSHRNSFRDLDTAWAGKKTAKSNYKSISVTRLSEIATGLREVVSDLASIAASPLWTAEERQEMYDTMTEALKALKKTMDDLTPVVRDGDESHDLDDMLRSYQAAAEAIGMDSRDRHESLSKANL